MGMPYGSSTPPVQPEEEDDPRILEVYRLRFSCCEVLAIRNSLITFPAPEQKIVCRSGSRICTTLSNKCARSSVSIPSSRWTQNFQEWSPDRLENLTQLLITNIRFVSALTGESDFLSKSQIRFILEL